MNSAFWYLSPFYRDKKHTHYYDKMQTRDMHEPGGQHCDEANLRSSLSNKMQNSSEFGKGEYAHLLHLNKVNVLIS